MSSITEVLVKTLSDGAPGLSDIERLVLRAKRTVDPVYPVFLVASSREPCVTCVTVSASTWTGRGAVGRPDQFIPDCFSPLPCHLEIDPTVINYTMYFFTQFIVNKGQYKWSFFMFLSR